MSKKKTSQLRLQPFGSPNKCRLIGYAQVVLSPEGVTFAAVYFVVCTTQALAS